MKVIWKFPLEIEGHQTVVMPQGARLLHVAAQGGKPTIWALVDPKAIVVGRRFLLCVTGTTPENKYPAEYVGTFLLAGGSFVGHIFDQGEQTASEMAASADPGGAA